MQTKYIMQTKGAEFRKQKLILSSTMGAALPVLTPIHNKQLTDSPRRSHSCFKMIAGRDYLVTFMSNSVQYHLFPVIFLNS